MAHLVGQHLALARAELRGDLRSLASAAVVLVAMAIPLVLGYALGMVAVALVLTHWLGLAGAFGVVAGGNLLLGGLGVWRSVRKMTSVDVGDTATEELKESVSLLSEHARAPAGENHVA